MNAGTRYKQSASNAVRTSCAAWPSMPLPPRPSPCPNPRTNARPSRRAGACTSSRTRRETASIPARLCFSRGTYPDTNKTRNARTFPRCSPTRARSTMSTKPRASAAAITQKVSLISATYLENDCTPTCINLSICQSGQRSASESSLSKCQTCIRATLSIQWHTHVRI
ncbi:hypothetical protein EI94DRAFT_1736474, partial [Lactarius quietus]